MTNAMEFFIFLMEHYASYKKTTANIILQELEELKLTEFIYSMHERYQREALENTFADIDTMIKNAK